MNPKGGGADSLKQPVVDGIAIAPSADTSIQTGPRTSGYLEGSGSSPSATMVVQVVRRCV